MFSWFQFNRNSHLRRAMALLEEAHMARLEHQAAAEHHAALARMYTERAKRLEREIYGNAPAGVHDGNSVPPKMMPHDKSAALYALDAGATRPGELQTKR